MHVPPSSSDWIIVSLAIVMIDHNDDFGFALKSPFQIAVLDSAMSSYANIGAL